MVCQRWSHRAALEAKGVEGSTQAIKERTALAEPLSSILRIDCRAVDGSSFRFRPEHRNHVWSYGFVHCRTDDGKAFRTLNIIDEFSRECLAIKVKRKLNATDVIDALTDLFILRGATFYIRSDNGPSFVALAVRDWIAADARLCLLHPL